MTQNNMDEETGRFLAFAIGMFVALLFALIVLYFPGD